MGKEEFIQELTFKNSRFVNDINTKLSNLDKTFNDFLSKFNKVNSELQQCQKINSHLRIMQHQCITLRQRMVRYHLCTLVHYSCALLFAYFTIATFFMLHLFSFCFMLQLLHVALFCVAVAPCCTFSKMHFFILYSSKFNKVNSELQQCQKINSHLRIMQHQCITLRQRMVRYHLCTLVHYSCALLFAYFTIATFFMLHLFSFCFMLQLLHVALFCVAVAPCCTFSKMHFFILYSFQVALFSCYNLFMLHLFCVLHSFHVAHVLCCTFSVLHIFYIALFSSCTFFVLYTFRVALFRVALLFFMLHLFSCCTMLHCNFFRIVSCCSFFKLHYFHVLYFFYITVFSS